MNGGKWQAVAIIAGALIGAGLTIWMARKTADAAGSAVSAVGNAVNPASPQNLVYTGINSVGDVLDNGSRDSSWSLGTWIYDITHPSESDPNNPLWH